jgi:hypothetical protein
VIKIFIDYIWLINQMKKTAPLFLLTIFLFNTMGYFIVFKIAQHQIKSEVADLVSSFELSKFTENNNELTKIKVHKNELYKIDFKDKGKEIFLDNKMYDIVKTTETDEHMIYHCLHDKKESILVAGLKEHVNNNVISDNPIKNNSPKKTSVPIIKLYFQNNEISFTPKVKSITSITLDFKRSNYNSISLKVSSPPPELA